MSLQPVRLTHAFYIPTEKKKRKIKADNLEERAPGQGVYLIGICQLSEASFQIMEVLLSLQNKPGKTKSFSKTILTAPASPSTQHTCAHGHTHTLTHTLSPSGHPPQSMSRKQQCVQLPGAPTPEKRGQPLNAPQVSGNHADECLRGSSPLGLVALGEKRHHKHTLPGRRNYPGRSSGVQLRTDNVVVPHPEPRHIPLV